MTCKRKENRLHTKYKYPLQSLWFLKIWGCQNSALNHTEKFSPNKITIQITKYQAKYFRYKIKITCVFFTIMIHSHKKWRRLLFIEKSPAEDKFSYALLFNDEVGARLFVKAKLWWLVEYWDLASSSSCNILVLCSRELTCDFRDWIVSSNSCVK